MPENETIRKQIVSIDVDKAASQRVQKAVSALRVEFDALGKRGTALHEQFKTQGAAANKLYGQIANLNDEYKAGRIDQAKYLSESTRLNAELKKADRTFGDTAQAIRQTDTAVKDFYKDTRTSTAAVKAMTEETRAAADETQRLGQAQTTAAQVRATRPVDFAGRGLVTAESRVRQVTGLAMALGGTGIAQPLNIGADVLGAAGSLKLLKQEMGLTATQAGVLGVATVAVGAAFLLAAGDLQDAANATKSAVVGQVDAIIKFNKEAAGATTDQALERMGQLEDERSILVQTRQDLLNLKKVTEAGVGPDASVTEKAALGIVQIGDKLGLLNYGLDEVDSALSETDAQLRSNATQYELWIGYLKSGKAAAYDFTEAEKQRQEQERQAAQLLSKGADLIRSAHERFSRGAEKVASSVDKAHEKTRSWADDFVTAFNKTQNALVAYQQEISRINEQRAIQSIREEEDAARRRVNAIADHYRDLARLDEQMAERREDILSDMADASGDAEKDRLDLIRDTNREAARAAREHSKRLSDIQRDTNRDIRKAALRMDAIGIYEAREAGEEALRQENEQYEEEKRQREEDMQDRLREIDEQRDERLRAGRDALADLERQHQRERDTRVAAFQQQLSREDQERAIRLSRQQQDWAREDALRQQNFQQQLAGTSGFYSELNGRALTGMENIKSTVTTKFSEMASAAAAVLSMRPASPAQQTASRVTSYVGRMFAPGGEPPVGQDVWVGEQGPEIVRFMSPARVYSHADSLRMAGGRSVQVNFSGDFIIQGNTPREQARDLRDQVEQVVYDIFERKVG